MTAVYFAIFLFSYKGGVTALHDGQGRGFTDKAQCEQAAAMVKATLSAVPMGSPAVVRSNVDAVCLPVVFEPTK